MVPYNPIDSHSKDFGVRGCGRSVDHYFLLEMEVNGETFNDWGALVVVDEFESKPGEDYGETERNNIGDICTNGVNGASDNSSININNNENCNNDVHLDDQSKKSSSSSSPEVEFRGSIAERRAAKFGFDASRINVAKFEVSTSPSSPLVRSPYLTIPSGLSPAALLDSPVMLPNSQPSPTTGTLQLLHSNHDSFVLNSDSPAADRDKGSAIHTSNPFKPPADPTPIISGPLSSENQLPMTSKSPPESRIEASVKSCALERSIKTNIFETMPQKANHVNSQTPNISVVNNQLPHLREGIKSETGIQELHREDQKGTYPGAAEMSRNAEDGYSWRKYGQKHVKGSEYPRSYYKCNNSNCPVKKKVERSHDGEITEIIYKGAHNHPKPHPRISLGPPSQSSEMLETSEGSEPGLKAENRTGWRFNNQLIRSKDFRITSDWRPNGMERTSSTSVLTEILDPLATTQGKSAKAFGSTETPEIALTAAYQDGEDDDRATQGSTSQGDEADADESEPKRRQVIFYFCTLQSYLPSRSTREPRVIVQIESEIDVLDDGYRWRKYGQKVVKGNPNPRSYYKCTSAGCPVRKHVERASDDIKSVLTTYEGKHNHEVPTNKTSGLPSASNSPPDVSDPNSSLIVPRNPSISNRELQVQDLPLHYEMKPALGNHDFLRSNLLGDFVTDHMQIGASPIYQMKFPPTPLQNPLSYSTFLMNSSGSDSRVSCQKFPPVVPDFPMSIPINVPRSSPNMALNNAFHSYNHNQTIPNATAVRCQHITEGDLRFLRPKEEKEDNLYETCLATPDNSNVTSSTEFCRANGNFPS
ncbi:WRKY transcription factor SUSIBA2-like [Coffea eugenioides]|uniref:WRKY transcription factor SUSIBA2-like n=1 Tax=Coffea eugenioides TaxID=49369 RepID=UPI000F60A5B1|nr:WRKY transcription factor SUSIBA2-like [Coffea eugenioides]